MGDCKKSKTGELNSLITAMTNIKHLHIKSYNLPIIELRQSHDSTYFELYLNFSDMMANNCNQNKLSIWISKNCGGFVAIYVVQTEMLTEFTPSFHQK